MARIDILLKHPDALRQWLSKGEGRAFEEWIKNWADAERKTLLESTDVVAIYRAQGALAVLNRILGLREEVNTFLQRKSENKDGGGK